MVILTLRLENGKPAVVIDSAMARREVTPHAEHEQLVKLALAVTVVEAASVITRIGRSLTSKEVATAISNLAPYPLT